MSYLWAAKKGGESTRKKAKRRVKGFKLTSQSSFAKTVLSWTATEADREMEQEI